ncbi:PEP-CTERM sorting domain-containing protein [bacterium]|nr:MAG: PEP-CTERM sorting domain-containing protein [bacterium]
MKTLSILAAFSIAAASQAASVTFNLDGLGVYDVQNDPSNVVLSKNIGANSVVTGFSFDVNVTAFSPSYQSEIGFSLFNPNTYDGVSITLGVLGAPPTSGTGQYATNGTIPVDTIVFAAGNDGILNLELFDNFTDFPDDLDAVINSGTFTVHYETQAVPEPASLAAFGLGGLALLRRRRKA